MNHISELWDKFNQPNEHVFRVPKKKGEGTEKILLK